MERRVFLLSLLPLAAACDGFDCGEKPENADERQKEDEDCQPPTPAPTPIPEPVANTIEFRVLGDVLFDGDTLGASIQFGSTQEGTAHVVSTLPWFSSSKTFRDNLFLVLNVSATGFGFVQAQIIVNNELLREASASGVNPKVSISGLFSK